MLGLIYVGKNRHEEAFALLQPYADAHLKELHEAEGRYQALEDSASQRVVDELNKGNVPDFAYTRYKQAAKEQQQEMVGTYIFGRLKNDAALAREREAVTRASGVVAVALDLGILRLERAQKLNDAAARKTELEQAEKTFLAVRSQAGRSLEYQLSLGRVYYWLGKPAEGRKLFDQAVADGGRKFEALMVVARLLRELGAVAESRTFSEEAYNLPNQDATRKQQAALLRALTRTDIDDELVWLERANPTDPEAKASLATARGRKAKRDGKDAEAATFFRESAAIYAGLPEDAASLNNGGVASIELFEVTGERDALDRAVKLLEKALALKPDDGIMTGNVAGILLGVGLRDVLGDGIDLKKLKREAGLDLCSFLYADSAGRHALAQRRRDSATLNRARTHLERALVLAPNNPQLYHESQELLNFLDDRDGLLRLARRAAEANPDVATSRQEALDFQQGKADDKYRRDVTAAVARAERTWKDAEPAGGATLAVAAVGLVHARLGQELLGELPNPAELVRLAEAADRAAPSLATATALQAALLARASQSLAAREPEYAAMRQRARRSLGSSYLVAVALDRPGKLRDAALADPDVKRALESIRTQATRFSDDPLAWQWAMLRAAYPDTAAAIAAALKKDGTAQPSMELEARLTPASATTALRQSWALEAAGKTEDALAP